MIPGALDMRLRPVAQGCGAQCGIIKVRREIKTDYIETYWAEVEAEHKIVLQQAEENRRYWQACNRERLVQIAAMLPKPGQEEIREKPQAAKIRRGMV